MKIPALLPRLLVFAACALLPGFAYSQSNNSVVIWPINPVIESGERATPLRLENPGQRPILMQIRIFGWQQIDGDERFVEQKDITGTPPMVRIEPGQQQLIRLTRITPSPAGSEQSYRVIIDEIPLTEADSPAEAGNPAQGAGAAIRFRMRYSVPLFTYGEGANTRAAKTETTARPALQWRVVKADGGNVLQIRNPGASHSRLSGVAQKRSDGTSSKIEGAHGYILAGATMRFPIAQAVVPQARLFADVEDNSSAPMVPWQP
ncbi:fimbrial biogenesis chaperone [Novosphingobium resinovorum]|uniref:fimbrial biogenesis chaperone n=1 Tax=Novosphingobium resinovorum TaxID=158500 RepID=UPI0009F43AD1|nr:molecular chaperone [Novosphingobium resinovorum]